MKNAKEDDQMVKKWASLLTCLLLVITSFGCSQNSIEEEIDLNADQNTVVWSVFDSINEKSKCGEKLSALNEHERVLFVTLWLETEVNNGGFSQYFFNSCGDMTNELVASFEAIGAFKTAAICKQAIDAFGCEVPAERYERQNLLDTMNEDFDEALWACDDAFYDYEEDLEALHYAYIMAHAESFR